MLTVDYQCWRLSRQLFSFWQSFPYDLNEKLGCVTNQQLHANLDTHEYINNAQHLHLRWFSKRKHSSPHHAGKMGACLWPLNSDVTSFKPVLFLFPPRIHSYELYMLHIFLLWKILLTLKKKGLKKQGKYIRSVVFFIQKLRHVVNVICCVKVFRKNVTRM